MNSFPLDITLLIHFNHSVYISNIPFLLEIYQKYFKNVVFYSSKPLQEHCYDNLFFSDTKGGHIGYKCLLDFCETPYFTNTKGVLYIMDDVLLNINLFLQMDLTRPLYFSQQDAEILSIEKHLNEFTDTEYWGLWNRDTGRLACKKIISDNKNDKFYTAVDFFAKISDFFYLPSSCITQVMIDHLQLFDKHNLHLEIAIPSLFKKLFYQKYGMQKFNALPNILGGKEDCVTIYNLDSFRKHIYEPNLYVHRVKISSVKAQEYVRQILK